MSTQITNKQVKIVSNVNFNNKEIENAIIDAAKNTLTGILTELVAGNGITITNNNVISLKGTTQLTDGTDIDTIKTEGNYFVKSPISTLGLPSLPTYVRASNAGIEYWICLLLVEKEYGFGTNIVRQTITLTPIVNPMTIISSETLMFTRTLCDDYLYTDTSWTKIDGDMTNITVNNSGNISISKLSANYCYLCKYMSDYVDEQIVHYFDSITSLTLTNIEDTPDEIRVMFKAGNNFTLTANQLKFLNYNNISFEENKIYIITIKNLYATIDTEGANSNLTDLIPTKLSELENDSGYTTVADVNSEIIALSNELDVALNINSYQAVNNNAITAGIENSKVDVVEDFVTTLPSTVTTNQNYLNITNNKIYKAINRKYLNSVYTNTNLNLLSNGRIRGFGTLPTQQTKLTYNSNAWSYIFPIKLMFTTTGWNNIYATTSRIITLNRTDDDSTLFAIDLIKTQISGNNNRYIKFSTINRDGTIKEEISSNSIISNDSSIIEIEITKSCYIKVLINNKVNSIKYMDSLNASTSSDDDFYYALPVLATIKNSYSDTIKISQLFGLNSYMSHGYMGPSGTDMMVFVNHDSYQLDEGTDLVKNKLIVNSTEKKLYEYDGTQLNEIGSGGSSSVLKRQLYTFNATTSTLDVSSDFTTVVDVLKNGIEIYKDNDYTIQDNVLTFITPLTTTDIICVKGEE